MDTFKCAICMHRRQANVFLVAIFCCLIPTDKKKMGKIHELLKLNLVMVLLQSNVPTIFHYSPCYSNEFVLLFVLSQSLQRYIIQQQQIIHYIVHCQHEQKLINPEKKKALKRGIATCTWVAMVTNKINKCVLNSLFFFRRLHENDL